MIMNQFDIWLADLNPPNGTEPGKVRPVLIVQTDLLNKIKHPSTIVCPLTTKFKENAFPLRVKIQNTNSELLKDSEILIDQVRAIDNKRFIRYVGSLDEKTVLRVKESLGIVLDL
jgi:mRNA interferase MazF